MTYSFVNINSVVDIPVYPDVQHEVLPLGRGTVSASVQSASVEGLRVHIESFTSRIWYQEVQSGSSLYFGLFLPEGEPMRFLTEKLERPTLVSWNGVVRTEWDYVVEPGTRNYMIEMPAHVAKNRGWQVPAPEQMPVAIESARGFAAVLDAEVLLARKGAESNSAERLLLALDELTGNALYRNIATRRPRRSIVSQQKIVTAGLEYLKELEYAGSVTGVELSRAIGCSKRTLYAAFEAQLGLGPNQLHNMLRLYKLRSLLTLESSEHKSVSKLVHEAGFGHLGRTAGMYRAHFGETPAETLRRSG